MPTDPGYNPLYGMKTTPAATPAETKTFTTGVDKAQADFNKSLKDAKSTLAQANKQGNKVVAASARALIDQLNTVVKPALAILQKAENPNAGYTGEITPINQALGGGAPGSGPSGVVLGSGGKGAYSLDQIRAYMDANNGSFPPDLNTIASGITAADLTNLVNQYESGSPVVKPLTPTTPSSGTDSTAKRMDAIAAITSLLSSYGIGDLSASITDAVVKGYSSDTIQLIMQDPNSKDPLAVAFQTRFPANKARLAAGKSVLSAAEYLQAERSYTQVLQSYGVSNLATRDKLNSFITNDVSATEVADRVGLAIDRVKNADADTKAALALYYPMLNQGDIVGAVLDPAEGLPALQRKVQMAEIGGAALAQGLKTTNAAGQLQSIDIKMGQEALANLGITKKQAQEGFATVAEVTPRAQFLSDISTGQDYTQLQAEQEAFQGLASAKRARVALTEQEKARFGGSSGTTKGTLASQARGAI
jgi:hypothetical protein